MCRGFPVKTPDLGVPGLQQPAAAIWIEKHLAQAPLDVEDLLGVDQFGGISDGFD